MLGGQLGDAELRMSFAPRPHGSLAGHPVYLTGGDERDPRVLLSEGGAVPWLAVTAGELLSWHERELARREADFARSRQQAAASALDEQKIEEMHRQMQKTDPAAAEKMRASLLASLDKTRRAAAQQAEAGTQALARQRAAFDAYRASFGPPQLAAPGTMSGSTTREGVRRVDDPAGRPLARVDPAWAARDLRRVQLIVVSIAPQPRTDPEHAWQQASYEALDFGALARLLEP